MNSAYDKSIEALKEGIQSYETIIANNEDLRDAARQRIEKAEADKVTAVETREKRIESAHLGYKTSLQQADATIETAKNAIAQHEANVARIQSEIEEMKEKIKGLEESRDN